MLITRTFNQIAKSNGIYLTDMGDILEQAVDYPDAPDVEVLICTHDRAALLERTLKSLNAVEFPAGCAIGIFVVANACSDETKTFLQSYVGALNEKSSGPSTSSPWKFPLRWIEDHTPGKSHALNLALPQTKGNLIAFVDDDHRVDTGYLRAVCEAVTKYPQSDLFCGRILPDWQGSEPAWVREEGRYRVYPLPVPRFELGPQPKPVVPGTATPGGGNLAIRQGLFEKAGPFLLELGPQGHDLGGAEDIEWVRRAVNGGARLHYLPDMLQYHYVDPTRLTLSYIMRKAYERSASTTRLGNEYQGRFGVPPFMVRKALT